MNTYLEQLKLHKQSVELVLNEDKADLTYLEDKIKRTKDKIKTGEAILDAAIQAIAVESAKQ